MKFTITKIAAGLILAVATTGAQAAPVYMSGVFNMYSKAGYDLIAIGGGLTGNTTINVDTTLTGFVDYEAGTWGISSSQPFYGLNWTASTGTLVTTAGSYSLNTFTGAVEAGTGINFFDGILNFVVGTNQMAGVIDLAWGTYTMRIVDVWNINPDGGLTAVMAPSMEVGPFSNFNAAFNLTPVPEPETYAMMLAGLVLVGAAARRRKHAKA